MNLSIRQTGKATIVDVTGDITLYNAPQLRAMLVEQLKDKRAVRLIINLSEVKYIDSAGVASLVEGLKISRELKTGFALFGLQRARDRCLSSPISSKSSPSSKPSQKLWQSSTQFSNPLNRFPNISAAASSDTNRFNMPRSASIITSVSVTSTVPLIGVLNIAIFAESSKFSTTPATFRLHRQLHGNPRVRPRHFVKRPIDRRITSAFVRLCAIVIFIRFCHLTPMLRDCFSFVHTRRPTPPSPLPFPL